VQPSWGPGWCSAAGIPAPRFPEDLYLPRVKQEAFGVSTRSRVESLPAASAATAILQEPGRAISGADALTWRGELRLSRAPVTRRGVCPVFHLRR